MGRCGLCGLPKTLLLSHIAPRWAFQWMKREGSVSGSVLRLGVEYAEQDGNKHYLLCRTCEQWLGDAEEYLARITKGRPDDLSKIGVTLTQGPGLEGVNYDMVMRALAGIALKGHLAPSPPFTHFRLPWKLANRLRRQILAGEFPSPEMGIVRAWKWLGAYIPGANPRALLFPSLRRAHHGAWILDLEMAGWQWTVALADGAKTLREMSEVMPLYRRGDSWLYTPVVDMTDNVRINHGQNWKVGPQTGDRWSEVDLDGPCPCGLGERPFRSCCRWTWCYHPDLEAAR